MTIVTLNIFRKQIMSVLFDRARSTVTNLLSCALEAYLLTYLLTSLPNVPHISTLYISR